MPNTRNVKEFNDRWLSYDESDFSEPICNKCVHRTPDTVACKAYPDGIPDEILINDVDHRNPYTGDNGITFEERN